MFLTGCKGTDIILYTRYTDFGKNYHFCGMLYFYLNQNLLRPFHSGEPVIVARGNLYFSFSFDESPIYVIHYLLFHLSFAFGL